MGRDGELRTLLDLCARARVDEGPVAATIVAEPGIGKSRLLAELVARAPLPTASGAGYELARDVPFSTASELLRELARVPGEGEALDALLLGAGRPAGSSESLRVFEAAYRCLAEGGPRLLLVDDVQWADGQSLALVDYLVRASAGSSIPLAVVGGGRPSAATDGLAERLHRSLPADRVLELRLDPLSRRDGIALSRSSSPSLTEEEAGEIWRTAQGSPFWIELLSRAGGARTASDLLGTRFRALDPDASSLMATLAVAGRPVIRSDLGALLGWSDDRVRRAESLLVDGGLASPRGTSLVLAHDLIREAVIAGLPPRERARLHRLLAEGIERTAEGDVRALAEALEHRRAAGDPTGDLARRLARSPQRRLLGTGGLELLADVAAEGEELELLGDVAILAKELGRWEVALDAASTIADRAPDRRARARAALDAAEAAYELQRAGEAHSFIGASRRFAAGDEAIETEADARESQVLRWLENRVEEAEEPTRRAVAAGRSIAERAGGLDRLDADERRACLAALRAELDAAIRAADADGVTRVADEIGLAAREPWEVFAAAFDALFVLTFFDGSMHGVERRSRKLVAEARRLGLPAAEAEAMFFLSIGLSEGGKLEEAERAADATLELVRRAGAPDRFPLGDIRGVASRLAVSRGRWLDGMTSLLEQADAEPDAHVRLNLRRSVVWALVRFAPDRVAEVDERLAAMRRDAEAAGCDRCGWETVLQEAEVHARLGRAREALELLERWDAAHPEPLPGPATERAHVGALVEAVADPGAGARGLEAAAELADRAGRAFDRLWIRLDAAHAKAAVDREAAVADLRRLAEEAGSMGAASERQLALRSLRRLGVRAWLRAAQAGEPLTEREAEIARMAAAGASNPEIAAAMFVSRKTVERHVSTVLRKLGARNRTELASLLARQDAEVEGAPR